MIGAVDWDAWDEKHLREQIRANPLVKDKNRHKAERPFRLACIQLATYDGTVYNVRKVHEKIGHLCDYMLWDEAWIGYNAFHPAVRRSQPDARRGSRARHGRTVLDAVRAQTGRGLLAGLADPQARRAHQGPAPLHRAQALQRIVPDVLLDVAVLSAVRGARREREAARGQGRRDALGPLHRARHRGPQEAPRVRPSLREEGARRRGALVLRSVRARRRHDSRLEAHEGRRRTSPGKTCRPKSSSASSSAGPSIRRPRGTATRAIRRATRWSTRTSSCCSRRASTARPATISTSACPPPSRELPARAAHRAREVRSEQHPVPA